MMTLPLEKIFKDLNLANSKELSSFIHSFLEESPDPQQGLNNMERLLTEIDQDIIDALFESKDTISRISWIVSSSQFLTTIILRNPQYLSALFSDKTLFLTKTSDDLLNELLQETSTINEYDEMAQALRRYKQKEYTRIGARDLLGLANLEEVIGEISNLASASLEAAYRFSLRKLKEEHGTPYEECPDGSKKEAQFAVIGMGKLGGEELNFSSDIDIIYICSSEIGETEGVHTNGTVRGKTDLHTFFVKLSKSITKLIGEPTEDGFVFRVDLDLRPEGKSGDLINSLRSAEIYYESWGQPWERGAMIKARPVAGSQRLGEDFIDMIRPFVFRRYLDYTAIDEIKSMKEKIDVSLRRKGRGLFDVKLGKGGIREIEFFVQAIQLINGGKDPSIRQKSTLKAIRCLREKEYITPEEEMNLKDAYIFLRDVEHRLQIFHGRQTQLLPDNAEAIEKVAKTLRFKDSPYQDFTKKLDTVTENVHTIYNKLFYEAHKKLEEDSSKEILYLLDEDNALESLLGYGFLNPEKALHNLKLLSEGPPFAHYSAKAMNLLHKIAPFLITKIISSPAPDMALANMEKFISTVGARSTLLSLLAENRGIMELLVNLFGTSAFLSRFLIEHLELLDSFITHEMGTAIKEKEEMYKELSALIDPVTDYEAMLNVMRRFRNIEMLRIGIRDINGDLSPEDVSDQISCLADTCLQKACEIALEELKGKFGLPTVEYKKSTKEASFAILGLGKLGGKELIYGSDLDIVFIYSDSGETKPRSRLKKGKSITNLEFFAKLAQKIMSIISLMTSEGFVFKLDTRLRPSGSSGPLVTSLAAFELYHREKAQVWEKQALLKARFCAGDSEFGERVIVLTQELIYDKAFTKDDEKEINRLRTRMEKELGKETDEIIDIKFGVGGIVDIEFITQLLQLRHSKEWVVVGGANTLRALAALKEEAALSSEDCHFLTEAYSFYRSIENRLRIVEDRGGNKLFLSDPGLERFCKGIGFPTLEEFLGDYRRRAKGVRKIYEKFFSLTP
jgi:glutamate-ammonia-ligase adenylyltransferase